MTSETIVHDTDPAQLRARAVTHMDAGAWPEALDAWQAAIDSARAFHADEILVAALNGFGIALAIVGRPTDAVSVLREAVELARHATDPRLPMETLANYGNALMHTGNYAEAAAAYRKARAIAGEFDQPEHKILYSSSIGRALWRQGDYEGALPYLVDALRLSLNHDDDGLFRRVLDALCGLRRAWRDSYRFACGLHILLDDRELGDQVLAWLAMRDEVRQR